MNFVLFQNLQKHFLCTFSGNSGIFEKSARKLLNSKPIKKLREKRVQVYDAQLIIICHDETPKLRGN